MNLSDFVKQSVEALSAIYPLAEARGIVSALYSSRLGLRSFSHITEPSLEISSGIFPTLENDMRRLLRSEPLQYVLGECEFCSRRFRVNPSVLIPRPETEELVALARGMASPAARILDLCTGSGCIAWSLFFDITKADVTAVDISEDAIALARTQFDGPGPQFVCADVLKALPLEGPFDLLVSNPPYVMDSQKADMRPNVLDYEPSLALFVPDSDPLLFYRAIARRAVELGIPAGVVEANDLLCERTAGVFRDAGYSRVRIIPDISSRPRFVEFRDDGKC